MSTTSDPFLSPPSSVHTTPFLTCNSSNSRPNSPTRSYNSTIDSYTTLPTPPSSSTNPFQFDPTPSTSSNSSHSSSLNNQNNQQNNQYFDPIHSLAPPVPSIPNNMMTRAASAGSSSHHHLASSSQGGNHLLQQQVPPIISYDPNGSPSDEEEEDDDGESGLQGGGSRPRKRKSTRDLRGTASSQASAQASSSKAGNSGPSGDDDKDDDKGRRKIQIEYIEEKSKRHITFSKRKAGIMKKVSQNFVLSLLYTCQLTIQVTVVGLRTLNVDRNSSSPPGRL